MTTDIPDSWVYCTLDDLQTRISNGANVTQYEERVGYPISRIETIWNETIDFGRVKYIKEADSEFVAKYALSEGDILLSHINSDFHLGKTALYKNNPPVLIHGVNLLLIRLAQSVSSKFINYQFKFLRTKGAFISAAQRAVNQSSINQKKLKSFSFVLPPIAEQHRIVAKIEELFSELEKGVESLRTAREQLKIYRQSLLKAAFEGKLTEEWREENADTLQPAEVFLRQIRQEREDRHHKQIKAWEGEVGKWQAGGKQGKKPAKPKPLKKIDSPSPSELEALGALPLTWCWAKIGDVSSVGTGVTPLKSRAEFYEKGDIPWVTSGALNDNYVWEASGYVTKAALAETNLRLYPKHTLLMAMYGEGKTRGKCSELMLPATTNQAVAAMVQSGIEEETRPFLKWFMIKNYADIRRKSSGGVQPNLNLGIVENTLFPLCSIAEMREIDAELQRQLSVIEENERDIDAQLDKSNALRQSILKKAFRGQLVKQDPDDEPASALLARIAKQKEEAMVLAKKAKAAAKKEPKRKAKQ